ncbi:hypothetical protein Tco_1090225 [Tanacetum coccineum]|uniref:Uncharacterized protein n=1 Tax=Tanacetum coccineum TaxID=301880 RepID=A0ABQ5I584_9ASTR
MIKLVLGIMVQKSKVSETIINVSKVETSNSKTSNDKVEMPKIETVRMSEPIIEEWEYDSEDDEIVVKPKEVTKTVKPSFEKTESVNARNETIRQAENPRKNNKSPRGNKSNWNEKLKLLCVTKINWLLNCHSEVAVWIPLKLLLLKPDLWIVVLRIGKLQGIGEFSGVGFISTQQMVINSPCLTDTKNWLFQCKRHLLASPKQTALELAIPGQTATGKESSNPFMAGSLPKTIHFCDSLQSDEDSFELIELMILCTNFLTMVRDLENLKTTYLIMKKVWVRMHPNRGGLMMQMQRLPSLMRLQMMLETRTTRFQTAIRSEEVFGYILLNGSRSLATSSSEGNGIGVWVRTDILEVVLFAGGGGVAADSSVSNGSVSSAEGT